MKIKKINLENIRSYKNQEIEIPEGSLLLSGDIGSGKTTILLAIEFALFGLQPGQKGSSLLSNNSDEGKVKLELEIGEDEIIIERSLKKNSKSINQDYSAITINGLKEEMSVTELKTRILKILNYPPEFIKKTNILYRYTIYSPQELMKQIINEDPESRLNVLRHVFGVDKYKTIKENLSIVLYKIKEKTRLFQYEIRDLDEIKIKIESVKSFLTTLYSKVEKKNLDLIDKIKVRKTAESDLDWINKKLEEKRNFEKEIEKTRVAISYKTNEKSRIEKEIIETQNKIINRIPFNQDELESVIKKTNQLIESLELINEEMIRTSGALNFLQSKQKEDLSKKERIFKIDICPTCLQDVSEQHKHNILNETETELVKSGKEIKILQFRKDELDNQMKSVRSELSDLTYRRTQLEILKSKDVDISENKEKLISLKKIRDGLTSDYNLLEKQISLLKSSVLEFSKYDNLYNIKNEELKSNFRKEKEVEIELAEIKKEIEITKKEIESLEKEIIKKEVSKENLAKLLEIEQWLSVNFSDLITFTERNILLKLRNEFSKYFNKWFSMLTTDNFYVHLDETFTPIITQGDYELDYSFLSGGERTAVALAYRLALNQIINSIHSKINTQEIVILDEPTEGFSSQQLDKIRDVLQELNVKQLIMVSHEPKIESFVDNILKVHKESGISSITP